LFPVGTGGFFRAKYYIVCAMTCTVACRIYCCFYK
jgi:hypothetical protein